VPRRTFLPCRFDADVLGIQRLKDVDLLYWHELP
jgi:hypothetical protein